MSRLTKGTLIAIIGIAFWSTTGVIIGYLLTTYKIPALLLAFWRNLLVCVVLAPVLYFTRRSLLRLEWDQVGFFAWYGLLLAVFNSVWALSVKANGASVATVLAYSSAGFTAILALLIFREKLGIYKTLAVIFSLAGCVLVSNAYSPEMWRLNPMGVVTGLMTGLLFAGYTLFGKETSHRKINSWTAMLYSFGFGAVFIMIFNLFPALPGAAGSFAALLPRLPLMGWVILVFLSFVPTVLGFGLYNLSLHYLPAGIANILATSEPVMTAVEAYFLLGERMSLVQIIGGLITLLAVVIVQREKE